jgi:hypothetical protein
MALMVVVLLFCVGTVLNANINDTYQYSTIISGDPEPWSNYRNFNSFTAFTSLNTIIMNLEKDSALMIINTTSNTGVEIKLPNPNNITATTGPAFNDNDGNYHIFTQTKTRKENYLLTYNMLSRNVTQREITFINTPGCAVFDPLKRNVWLSLQTTEAHNGRIVVFNLDTLELVTSFNFTQYLILEQGSFSCVGDSARQRAFFVGHSVVLGFDTSSFQQILDVQVYPSQDIYGTDSPTVALTYQPYRLYFTIDTRLNKTLGSRIYYVDIETQNLTMIQINDIKPPKGLLFDPVKRICYFYTDSSTIVAVDADFTVAKLILLEYKWGTSRYVFRFRGTGIYDHGTNNSYVISEHSNVVLLSNVAPLTPSPTPTPSYSTSSPSPTSTLPPIFDDKTIYIIVGVSVGSGVLTFIVLIAIFWIVRYVRQRSEGTFTRLDERSAISPTSSYRIA